MVLLAKDISSTHCRNCVPCHECEQAELAGVGQRCYYWRIQGLPTLQKNKRRGPARVVAHETNDEKKVVVVWLAHGTNLLRCAPHQVQPVVEETGYATVADPALRSTAMSWSPSPPCKTSWTRPATTTMFRYTCEPPRRRRQSLTEGAPPTPAPAPSDPPLHHYNHQWHLLYYHALLHFSPPSWSRACQARSETSLEEASHQGRPQQRS